MTGIVRTAWEGSPPETCLTRTVSGLAERQALAIGDLGKIDADGYLRIRRQSKDRNIQGASYMPVVRIAAKLHSVPVRQALASIGYPDEWPGKRTGVTANFLSDGDPILTGETLLVSGRIRPHP